jgi:hypothetical protein
MRSPLASKFKFFSVGLFTAKINNQQPDRLTASSSHRLTRLTKPFFVQTIIV